MQMTNFYPEDFMSSGVGMGDRHDYVALEWVKGEIAETLNLPQYNVSKHLRVLREAELIELEKHGQQRLYALASAFAEHLAENKNVLDLGCCQFHFDKLPE